MALLRGCRLHLPDCFAWRCAILFPSLHRTLFLTIVTYLYDLLYNVFLGFARIFPYLCNMIFFHFAPCISITLRNLFRSPRSSLSASLPHSYFGYPLWLAPCLFHNFRFASPARFSVVFNTFVQCVALTCCWAFRNTCHTLCAMVCLLSA